MKYENNHSGHKMVKEYSPFKAPAVLFSGGSPAIPWYSYINLRSFSYIRQEKIAVKKFKKIIHILTSTRKTSFNHCAEFF